MGKFITIAPYIKGTPGEGAHPICVIKKLAEWDLLDEVRRNPAAYKEEIVKAATECVREGAYHGIYALVRGIKKPKRTETE